MRKSIWIFMLVMVILSSAALTGAQAVSDPPPLLVSGQPGDEVGRHILYQYVDASWERLPIDDFYAGSLSPDGGQLAYLRVPPFLQALLDDGKGHLYTTAWDVALVSLADGSRRELALQPPTITLDDDGYSGGIKRSTPVWSPDGSALAWIEQDYPAQRAARLILYDLFDDASRVLDDAVPPVMFSVDGLPRLLNWGPAGLALFTNDPSDNAETLRFYDATAGLQQVVRWEDDESWYPLAGPLWVADVPAEVASGGEVAAVQVGQYAWYRADPEADAVVGLGMQLELVSADTPDESLRLVWDVYAIADRPAWRLLAADGTELLAWAVPLHSSAFTALTRFVIAPSGQAAAYLQEGDLLLWQDGRATVIVPPNDVRITTLYWGPVRWRAGAAYDGLG